MGIEVFAIYGSYCAIAYVVGSVCKITYKTIKKNNKKNNDEYYLSVVKEPRNRRN